MFKIFLPLLLLSLCAELSEAQVRRRILIYPQTDSVAYTSEPGRGSCRMSVKETETAEVLEDTGGFLRVRFPAKRMQGCFGESMLGRDMDIGWLDKKEISYGDDDSSPAKLLTAKEAAASANAPCADPIGDFIKNTEDLRETSRAIKSASFGMKDVSGFDRYMGCYPISSQSAKNYASYSGVMNRITDSFAFRRNGTDYSVNPVMFRCLLRRESGFDPVNKSTTGAVGLGQHTNVNILHIKNRLEKKENWERQLWDRFFGQMKNDPEGRALLAQCPRTANGEMPSFKDKQDAACPLQSMAASALYNLQIQESLRRSSKVKQINWNEELNYQVAVGAAYNLGDGAAAKAVSDLVVSNWPEAIQSRAPSADKNSEVSNHIHALRNCMQKDNWNPMARKESVNNKCSGAATSPAKAKAAQ